MRRYMAGPPGPQGPPGPPGSSVGISASYSVDEIALHLFNIMNGSCRNHIQFQKSDPGFVTWSQIPLLPFSERGIARGPPGPPGPPGPAGAAVSGFATATIDYSALMRSNSTNSCRPSVSLTVLKM